MSRIFEVEPGLLAVRPRSADTLRAFGLAISFVGAFVATISLWYPMEDEAAGSFVILGLIPIAVGGFHTLYWRETYLDLDRRSVAEVKGLRPIGTRILLLGEIAERSLDEFDHLRVTSLFRDGWGVRLEHPLTEEELASRRSHGSEGEITLATSLRRSEARRFAHVIGRRLDLPVLDQEGEQLWEPGPAQDERRERA